MTWVAETDFHPGAAISKDGFIYRVLKGKYQWSIPDPGDAAVRFMGYASGAVEPDWDAEAPGIHDTVDDNDLTWENVGVDFTTLDAPFRREGGLAGQHTVDVTVDAAITDDEVGNAIFKADPVGSGKQLTFPAPANDKHAYQRTVRAIGAEDLSVDIVGGASPVTVPAGMVALVGFDAAGAFLVGAPF